MTCRLCEDRLLEYLYGELGEEQAAAMERHLEASEACRREYEGLASVLETVAETEEEGPPPALHARIMGHAEEARPKRRTLWGWILGPAVTTAAIGAITAGVYFTTIRQKPSSYLDERVVSEESLLSGPKQRIVPPSSVERADSPRKAAEEQAFRASIAEPPAAVEPEQADPERLDGLGTSERQTPAGPSMREEPFVAANSMDEERVLAPVPETMEVLPAEKDRVYGRGHRMLGRMQDPHLERAVVLASKDRCAKARKAVEACAKEHPENETCGAGWLEVARCYEKKGDHEFAREMAEKALAIPAYESEARAFLESLPPPAD
jgi:hypothetical protein